MLTLPQHSLLQPAQTLTKELGFTIPIMDFFLDMRGQVLESRLELGQVIQVQLEQVLMVIY